MIFLNQTDSWETPRNMPMSPSTIQNIPVDSVRMVSYSDASFATREKKQSQKGGMILAVHEDVSQQKSPKASPLVWFSRKIDRVVASTLAAELLPCHPQWIC